MMLPTDNLRDEVCNITLQDEDERDLRASILSPRPLSFGIGLALIAILAGASCFRFFRGALGAALAISLNR